MYIYIYSTWNIYWRLPVLGITTEFFLVNVSTEQLNVSAATVELLLMLDRVLDDQSLFLVAELWELGRDSEESVIRVCLDTCS